MHNRILTSVLIICSVHYMFMLYVRIYSHTVNSFWNFDYINYTVFRLSFCSEKTSFESSK